MQATSAAAVEPDDGGYEVVVGGKGALDNDVAPAAPKVESTPADVHVAAAAVEVGAVVSVRVVGITRAGLEKKKLIQTGFVYPKFM